MRIVITEFMDPRAVAQLEACHEVLYAPDLVDNPARLLIEARTADAIIVRNRTQVRGDLLDQLTQCRCVGRLGVGLDNIDVEGCVARNIAVLPATGANSLSVAEYVISAMMTLLRPVFGATTQMTQGKWPRAALSDGGEVGGKRLGVIGYGAIGQTSARLARGLGMTVIAFDAMLPPEAPIFAQTGVQAVDLDTLLQTADVITLHVPLVASTRGLIGADQLARMRHGTLLINTSRGHIVDLTAVANALRSGHLGGAAIDVFDVEPLTETQALTDCPNLLLTPHISGLTKESNERVSFMIADQVLAALAESL